MSVPIAYAIAYDSSQAERYRFDAIYLPNELSPAIDICDTAQRIINRRV
jgi:hypothetical protein